MRSSRQGQLFRAAEIIRFLRALLCAAIALVINSQGLCASTFTWDGNSGTGGTKWSTGSNWDSDAAPGRSAGADLVFDSAFKLANTADGGSWTLNSLNFASGAGAFTIDGSSLYVGAGGITNSSSQLQTIDNSIRLTANQTWNASTGGLVFGSNYNNAQNNALTLAGAGSITVSGQLGNVSTLTTTDSGNRTFGGYINAGTVNVQGSGATTFNGQLNVSSTINVGGSGSTSFGGYVSASTVNVQSTGATAFGDQLNVTSLNVTAGSNTFSTVYATNLTVSSTADATFTGDLGANTIAINGSGNVTIGGQVDYGTLVLNGTGTTTLSGTTDNNISSTIVNSGTLVMAQADGTAINGSLVVNGGVVSFEGDNQIPNWSSVTLTEGSMLLLNDTIQSFESLTITGDTIIDFGGSGSTLNIGSINVTDDAVLMIINWNNSLDSFIAQTNPSSSIVQVSFEGGATAGWTAGSGNITPVPEPATYGTIFIGGMLGLFGYARWRARNR